LIGLESNFEDVWKQQRLEIKFSSRFFSFTRVAAL